MKQLDIDSSGDREFFEMSLDHLCVAGFDGYWKRLNSSWTRTLGFTADELMARPIIDFVHPEDRGGVLEARCRLKDGAPLRWLVNRYRCKDGTYRWFEWRSVANIERQVVYAIARDVTDEHEAQRVLQESRDAQETMRRQLILADRMASVGVLAAGVAHEINNPLGYVMANLEMIVEELADIGAAGSPARLGECLVMARDAHLGAERIRRIVRGLKTFSRAEHEQRAVVDLTGVIELAIQMTFNEIRHRARLVRDFAPMPLVLGDDARLGQVFINLVVNAVQAIGEGSPDANEIRIVTGTDAAGNAFVEVRDTGPGIAADALDKVFDPFFTTKPIGVGTGLGLSICHNIVTGIGGQLTVTSGGTGAAFRVTLPPAPPPATEAAPLAAPASSPSRRAAILVVDDEEAIGHVLRFRLREHDVTAVTSGRAALELLDSGARFDVLISDLMMPEMSGMQLYAELQRVHPEAAERVVFMTGGAFTGAAHAFLERVPNECLEKPFSASAMRAAIQRLVK